MSSWGARKALRLYPARYRSEHGDELAGVYEDTTAGAGPIVRARELADLAGYGLRLRTGLTSGAMPGRLLGLAAPFAAGALATPGLGLLAEMALDVRHGHALALIPHDPRFVLAKVAALGCLLGAVAALFGRWPLARWAVAVGSAAWLAYTVAWIGLFSGYRLSGIVVELALTTAPWMLWSLLLLAAPPDLHRPPSRARTAALLAGAALGGPVLADVMFGPMFFPYRVVLWDVAAPALMALEVLLLVLAVPAARRGRLLPAAGAIAGLPVGLVGLVVAAAGMLGGRPGIALVVGGLVVFGVVVERLWRTPVPELERSAV
ncbi:hypothetical protein GCM10010441_33070 [Kitasatospora paracochleata]|uniref:Uncharacterized protein n=1 Tax=Kitasatospora paracochleata TaxID=58354 RepID=A0ABT1IQ89_9ACTN|nr:hypothetical protein [Kitasatospora paracochleata]MCP2307081.1 hypothetical protein [Kitasatospora paracochleata]